LNEGCFTLEDEAETMPINNNATAVVVLSPYRSPLLLSDDAYQAFLSNALPKHAASGSRRHFDPFWEQIKLEAQLALEKEPGAGPQLYQGILGRSSLRSAISSMVSHEIETELIPATALKGLLLELLTPEDEVNIRLDLQAVATRSAGIRNAMNAVLFDNGFHAVVCYRVGHRLWQVGRTGLAYYLQSVVSRRFAADIHPACRIGGGCYIRGTGCVIGETAVVGNDVSILEGVTLGGTGKEAGDRHPKIGNGVIIKGWAAVLGNIPVGDGAVVEARSIVTKAVPPLASVSGVPARIQSYRSLDPAAVADMALEVHLAAKYFEQWKKYVA
jgi:serine O-acetyltransferase